MQRSNHADPTTNTPGPSPSGFYPMGQNPAAGGLMPLSAASRSWPTLVELFNALKRRMVLATFLGILVGLELCQRKTASHVALIIGLQ